MSEVTPSIEEPIVRVSQPVKNYCHQMGIPPRRMVWLAIIAGMMALTMCEGAADELNATASEPSIEETTVAPPPMEAVTDLYSVPLAAFKVRKPADEQKDIELIGLQLGKSENNTDAAATPPFSTLWFNAGQSLGSAASSLTGWLNSRLVPQVTTTTQKPPDVVVHVQSQQKPLISLNDIDTGDKKGKFQGNRVRPGLDNTNDDAEEDIDDDDDEETEEEYNDGDEEQGNTNSNRYSNNDDDFDDDNDSGFYDEDEEEEEEEVRPAKKRRVNKNNQNRRRQQNNRRGYNYNQEDQYVDHDDYEDDDDEDYDYDYFPSKNSGRKQTQQSLFNRFRQLAKRPESTSNKQKKGQTQKPGYRPVRIVQNGQMLQYLPSNKEQVNRRRRPVPNSETSFQLIPIRNNQASTIGQSQHNKNRKQIVKPDQSNQIVIPIQQGSTLQNGQKRPTQFITIPWSKLGITNPQKDGQPAQPIIVNIPQYALQQNTNSNRRRLPVQNPSQAVTTTQIQRLRRPQQNAQVLSLLSDQAVRDIFRVPEIPPSRTPPEVSISNKYKRPQQQSNNVTTNKPASSTEDDPEIEEDDESADEEEPYIVVGDDDTEDMALPRNMMPKRYLHYGGMKPYVDVLNKGRFYLKSGRQMRIDLEEKPESEIIAINPHRMVDITTESLSETKANAPPTIASQDTSTTVSPLSQ